MILLVFKWLFFILFLGLILIYLFPPVTVCGNSMLPTYYNGELLLSTRLFRRDRIEEGGVYVFKSPTHEGRLLIKRVKRVRYDLNGIYFLGDNTDDSHDSRDFGYVDPKNIVAKIIKPRIKFEEDN